MKRGKKTEVLADLILVMLMSSSISQALYTSLFMTRTLNWIVFPVVIPLTLLFFVMFRNKLSTLISFISVTVLLTAGFSVVVYYAGIDSIRILFKQYSIWFVDMTNGYYDRFVPFFKNITVFSLVFIITLFVFVFTIKFFNFYVTTLLFFCIFFVQLQLNVTGSDFSFVLFIFSYLLYYFFYIQQRRSREKTYDVGNSLRYLVYLIPVCILVIAITFLFPQNKSRFDIPWLDTRIDKTVNGIVDKFSGVDVSAFDYFSFGISGFGKTDRLGGNLKLSNTNVMEVKADHSNLYLRAACKANYDGHRWYSDENQHTSLGLAQAFDKKLAPDSSSVFTGILNSLRGEVTSLNVTKNDYFEASNAEVKFVNIKTKSLFMPVKAYSLKFKAPQEIARDSEQMLSTKDTKGKGFTYTLSYYNLNLKNEKLIGLLKKSRNSDNAIMIDSGDQLYKKYTQLPDTVTPRIKALAEKITKDKHNNYDRAKAIETYLSKNYPYTLTPGTPPRSRDFVDYFLFEGNKGYCTYYASAMTVLLRCLHIPARFVEGYILPPARTDGVYRVTNQQAHAWVEVYFDSFGWIPFEPTSPFLANLYEDRTLSATMSSEMMDTGYQDYMELINKYRNEGSEVTYKPQPVAYTDSSMKKPVFVLVIVACFLVLLILAVGATASINYFKFYNLQRKIKKGDPNTSMLAAYNYILKTLKFQGVNVNPGETPTQFCERVEKLYDFKSFSYNKTSFTKISGYYVKARYSQNHLTSEEIDQTLEFINILLDLIVEKSGKFKFGFSRYILGRL